MNISLSLAPLVSLLAGILILIARRLHRTAFFLSMNESVPGT